MADIDTQRIRELLSRRDEIDAELTSIFSGTVRQRAPARCSKCGEEGHRVNQCPKQTEQ